MSFLQELNDITLDMHMLEGDKAFDLYFEDSYIMNLLFKQKGAVYKEYEGGSIEEHIQYDGGVADAYTRSEPGSLQEKETLGIVRWNMKYYKGTALYYETDKRRQGNSDKKIVDYVVHKIDTARKELRDLVTRDLYSDHADDSKYLSGLQAICDNSDTRAYAETLPTKYVSTDGKKAWVGRRVTDSQVISIALIDELRRLSKFRRGKDSKPNICVMDETRFNKLAEILRSQQIFTKAEKAQAGFQIINVNGCDCVVEDEDFLPSASHMFLLNTNWFGVVVDPACDFTAQKWRMMDNNVEGAYQNFLLDAQMIATCRKAHLMHTNVQLS